MNERIQELTIEANKYATEQHPMSGDADAMTKEIIIGNRIGEAQQKLAEMLIRECAMLVEGFILEQEVALDDYQEYEASAVLKEHFGVEL